MKLSIISKDHNAPHVQEIIKAARRKKVAVEIVNFENFQDFIAKYESLGEVIYWRASSLDIKSERAAAGALLKDKLVINRALFDKPYVTHKLYQQIFLRAHGQVNTIPTFRYYTVEQIKQAIAGGDLKFPFVAKPNLGAHGTGVSLIRNVKDLRTLTNLKELVFQNYIPNRGDWRVLILGGRVLGVMRRQAKPGMILNNIAQGGRAFVEADPAVLVEVVDIATKAAAGLGLAFCGVDVICDDKTGQYYFLEVNTAPEWLGGFQPITGVNVGQELASHCLEMANRRSLPVPELVRQYYDKSLGYLTTNPNLFWHYTSRLYLWSGDGAAKKLLQSLRADYIGISDSQIRTKLEAMIDQKLSPSLIPKRRRLFNQYSRLRNYNLILFKVLFVQSIYKQDIRPIVKSLGLDKTMLKYYYDLIKDEKGLRILSTHAVNFCYLLENYLHPEGISRSSRIFWKLAEVISSSNSSKLTREDLKLQIYLLMHIIIGESGFYQRPLTDPKFLKLIKYIEQALSNNYFTIGLDLKLEFIICAAICGCQTSLHPLVQNEAENSLSEAGNFLVDTHNVGSVTKPYKDRLMQSEHRSVLYLMSVLPFQKTNLSAKDGVKS